MDAAATKVHKKSAWVLNLEGTTNDDVERSEEELLSEHSSESENDQDQDDLV